MKGVQHIHWCYLWDLKCLVGGELKKRRRTQRLPHIPPQPSQPTGDSHPGPSGTTGGELSLGGQWEGWSGETRQSPIGSQVMFDQNVLIL